VRRTFLLANPIIWVLISLTRGAKIFIIFTRTAVFATGFTSQLIIIIEFFKISFATRFTLHLVIASATIYWTFLANSIEM